MSMEYVDGTIFASVGWNIVIFNCTNPLAISVYDTIDLAENIGYFGIHNDVLYMGTWDSRIRIYDVSDPSSPVYETYKDSDGNALAFVSDRGGVWAVWVMTPDGKGKRQVFTMQGPADGFVGVDDFASRGWAEERISWTR